MAQLDYIKELERAFRDNLVQHAIEQDGYSKVTPEEAYLYRKKGAHFCRDVVQTAFQYSFICSQELGIPTTSDFFSEMQKRNRNILVHFLAMAIYKFGARNVCFLPHCEEGGELERNILAIVRRCETYSSLRSGKEFKNFAKDIYCRI